MSPPSPRPVSTARSAARRVARARRPCAAPAARRQKPSQSVLSGRGTLRRILGADARSPRRPEPRAGGGRHARGRPAGRRGRRGHRQDADRGRTASPGSWTQGLPAEQILALTFSARGRGRPPRAPRGAARVALRGAPRRDVPLLLPAPAPGRGARGGRGPVPLAGHAGRPARAPARADRRPLAARSRDPRQPGAAPRQLRLAHRPAEERDGLGGGLPGLRRAPRRERRQRRRARPRRARARVRAALRGPRPAARRARGARLRGPGPARLPAPARAATRARARGAPLPARPGGRVPGDDLRRGHAAPAPDRGARAGDGRRLRRPLPGGAARRDASSSSSATAARAGASSMPPRPCCPGGSPA